MGDEQSAEIDLPLEHPRGRGWPDGASDSSPPTRHARPAGSAEIAVVRITECDHVAQAFWTLGDVVHEVPAAALFASLPDSSCGYPATHERSCFMADALDANGDIVDDREITEELAQTLLDEPIPVLRDRFRTMLWDLYGATG